MRKALILAVTLSVGPLVAADECITIEGDRIVARDLARANPVFGRLKLDLPLAYAPIAGVRRVLTAAQLTRLIAVHGLPESPVESICLERASDTLTAERMLDALRKALDQPEAKLELVDFSRYPVPVGTLNFSVSGLSSPGANHADKPVLWRGRVRTSDRRSVAVWARVRISVSRRQVVVVRDLPPGTLVSAEDVEEVTVDAFPTAEPVLESTGQAVGRLTTRRLRAGQPIEAAWLREPNQVDRGGAVSVTVVSGAARVEFDAKAETAGALGDTVWIRNPTSGERFAAEVTGPGKVLVRVGAEKNL